jgi:hypothetical protein
MPEPIRPLTADQALLDVKKRSLALRVLLDHAGVRKFKEELPGLAPIKVPIDFASTLATAKFIYGVVKNERERAVFLRDPAASLTKAGLQSEVRNASRIVGLVKDLVAQTGRPNPGDVFDSYSSKETDTHQQWNFDSSGRSAETKTGSIVGEKTKFDGFGIVEEIFANPQLGHTFFPDQPLVTPELMIEIRRRLDAKVGG